MHPPKVATMAISRRKQHYIVCSVLFLCLLCASWYQSGKAMALLSLTTSISLLLETTVSSSNHTSRSTRHPPPPCVEPLEAGKNGTCWFHSQFATTCRQDEYVFELLGGTVDKASCAVTKHFCLMSDFSQEVRKCNCTAPSSLAAFGGDFLEIGAADGLYLSNTAFFEYQMNWKGVCIEASPASFQKLHQNRPNCHAVNAVVGREFNGKNSTFLTILKYNSWEIGMSGMLGGKGMLHSIESAQEYAKKVGGTLQVDQVPGILLSDVYDRAGISKIDYASIDVEGAEEAVLKTWNTSKVPVGLLDSEHKAIEHVIKDWGLEKMNGPLIDVWYKSKNGFPL